jgi:predicted O-methyltransferase YrrM
MQQKIFQAKQWFKYILTSKTRWGHGVHSPFVYNLIEQIFNHDGQYYSFSRIEEIRAHLLNQRQKIEVEDFGAGSVKLSRKKRRVSSIAYSSLLGKEHAQLLFRLINRFQPKNIIELGTSLGVTSAYLASAYKKSQLHTFEGSSAIADIAKDNFKQLKLDNIQVHVGNFDQQLPEVLKQMETVDFAFIDGNHRYQATLDYFELLLQKASPSSVFVFDDIYWSKGMTKAWKEIIARPEVKVSIDLYRMGLVFFRKESPKQDFRVRF